MKSYMLNKRLQMEVDLREIKHTFVAAISRWVMGYYVGYYGWSMTRARQGFVLEEKSNSIYNDLVEPNLLENLKWASERSGSEDVDG